MRCFSIYDHDHTSQSLSCPKCIGLPEEIRITNGLLRQQYAVVAVSSTGHCWGEEDFERTKKILEIVAAELGHPLPLYAIGASSGGSFVAHLPNFMAGFKAVVCVSLYMCVGQVMCECIGVSVCVCV